MARRSTCRSGATRSAPRVQVRRQRFLYHIALSLLMLTHTPHALSATTKPNTHTSDVPASTSDPKSQHEPRKGHPNVFSRLQALFPASPSLSSPLPPRTPSLGTDASNKHAHAIPPPAKSLKVRIITWNMHESLPKVRPRSSVRLRARIPSCSSLLFPTPLVLLPICSSWRARPAVIHIRLRL